GYYPPPQRVNAKHTARSLAGKRFVLPGIGKIHDQQSASLCLNRSPGSVAGQLKRCDRGNRGDSLGWTNRQRDACCWLGRRCQGSFLKGKLMEPTNRGTNQAATPRVKMAPIEGERPEVPRG